jgi:hypothetical protein
LTSLPSLMNNAYITEIAVKVIYTYSQNSPLVEVLCLVAKLNYLRDILKIWRPFYYRHVCIINCNLLKLKSYCKMAPTIIEMEIDLIGKVINDINQKRCLKIPSKKIYFLKNILWKFNFFCVSKSNEIQTTQPLKYIWIYTYSFEYIFFFIITS